MEHGFRFHLRRVVDETRDVVNKPSKLGFTLLGSRLSSVCVLIKPSFLFAQLAHKQIKSESLLLGLS